jgi:L,D-peptidoglycan transpeptidase YkuD (ErfK/YbiS/YcfS/YnhG family)
MRKQPRGQLFVRALSRAATRGILLAGGQTLACALGRSGRRVLKREGDGATPFGIYSCECVYYRPDRGPRPRTRLPLRPVRSADGWCDAVADRNYNRRVQHPYPASAERMWRQDGLYDLLVVLNYNRRPRVRGRGSAIFLHVAQANFTPTEGCIALRHLDLLRVLAVLRRGSRIHIS